jgi:hypothetical protein
MKQSYDSLVSSGFKPQTSDYSLLKPENFEGVIYGCLVTANLEIAMSWQKALFLMIPTANIPGLLNYL